jgi:hypothetical protein
MAEPETERWVGELAELRREIAELRNEQRELARAVGELTKTFRALALQLGIAAEPYPKSKGSERGRDAPGFA